VRLPIAPVRQTSAEAPRLSPPPNGSATLAPDANERSELSGLKVLVVDDEADARDLLQLLFEHRDAAVTSAASVAEALELVPRVRPDVIVSDIGMPGEDGYSFIRKLRKFSREDGGRTPAVALTAYARSEDRTLALKAGFQSHASKPVDAQELLLVIANLVGRYS
jgi:CheY-like chemotaxis protein